MTISKTPHTLRERQKAQTRAEIHAAALDLVGQHGLSGVTVEMISDRAGVSPRTFFNYFPSKETAIVVPVPSPSAEGIQEFLYRQGWDDLMADLAELAFSALDQPDEHYASFEEAMRVVMATPELAKLQFGAFVQREHDYAALIAARLELDVDDERPELIAAVLMTAIRVAGARWSRRAIRRSLIEEMRTSISDVASLR